VNVNGLNCPIKRHPLANLLLTGDATHRQKQALVEGERLKEDLPSKWPPKTGRGSNTSINKVDLKLTLIKRDKEGYSILIKGKIHQKEMTIINLYSSNVNASNFIKQTLRDIKTYIDSNTVGDFNTPYHQ
jgi:hypothetical protein